MAKRKNKMSTADAVKILANEMKIMKQNQEVVIEQINYQDLMIKDYFSLFERYMEHTKDGASFIKKMEELVKRKKKEIEEKNNEQKANESVDEENTDGDKQDERVGTEGVRSQEG